MKTATVTWISYNNYGTLLQAYALQQQIKSTGHDNVILSDYKILKEFKTKQFHIVECADEAISFDIKSRLWNLLTNPRRIFRVMLARINRKEYERPYTDSQKKCEDFKHMDLDILYDIDYTKFVELNKQYDTFIAGSDQIWSVFEKVFNPYYYLDFVTKKKIAYAPSLGTDTIPEKTAARIKELLSDYFAVSVRESLSAQHLSELTGQKVKWVADPTLLHEKQFWCVFTVGIPTLKKKYLLCYFLENKEWYFEYARKLARQLHLEIVLIPNRWDYISSEYVIKTGVGPKEFVSLIQHAEYVLTDSYHGSIFSLIFERNFQYLLRFKVTDPNSQNMRIQSLFDYLDLTSRIISSIDSDRPAAKIENYNSINTKIETLRIWSQNYLKECLK